jgi:tripartite-type tricarboxylate transporter receptor subunit TctC
VTLRLGRRGGLALAFGLAAPALLPVSAEANRRNALELLVGAPPASPADLWARSVAPFLERHWTRGAVAVRNHPGRGGLDAMAVLAASPPDRKLMGVVTAPLLLTRAIEAGEASPLSRISPLAAVLEESMVLVGPLDGPTDLTALRSVAAGRPLGTPAPGSAGHVAGLRLDSRLDMAVLAFPSAAAARQAALSGHVPAAMLALPDAIQALREEKIAALAIAAARRSPLLPDIATFREQGIDLVASAQRGFALPPGVPEPVRDHLLAGLEALTQDPDFIAAAAAQGQNARFLGPANWMRLLGRVDEEMRRRWQEDPWLPRRV